MPRLKKIFLLSLAVAVSGIFQYPYVYFEKIRKKLLMPSPLFLLARYWRYHEVLPKFLNFMDTEVRRFQWQDLIPA